jgi:hypothetical protein
MKRTRQAPVRISAELRDAIAALTSGPRGSGVTLHAVRLALQQNNTAWTAEGEMLHPQDRTALLIEIDELIERQGKETPARDMLPGEPA